MGAVLILLYTFLGGFVAVSLVDTLQGILIGIVAVILPVAALINVGGFPALSDMLTNSPASYADVFGGRTGMVATGFVLGLTATGFGALGQPHLVAWIMGTKDRKSRFQGGAIAISWGALVYAGMGILGLSARILFGDTGVNEGVFFGSAERLLPGVFAGIIAATTLSAIMSTVDSQLLVTGAALSHDMGLARLAPKYKLLISRIAIGFVCLSAIAVTLLLPSSIFERVLFAWIALGATFGPVVVVRAAGWKPSGIAVLTALLTGFGLSTGMIFIMGMGTGSIWSTIAPWVGAFCIFGLDRILRRG